MFFCSKICLVPSQVSPPALPGPVDRARRAQGLRDHPSMGKGKQKARPAATDDSDDALLRAAIAENAAVLEKAALESQRVQAEQAARQEAREAACAQRDEEGAPLSREAICSLMDGIPTFCIVDDQKQFVPLRVQGVTGPAADCCVAWTEPLEAQRRGQSATSAVPQFGCCSSSRRTWRFWLSRHSE